MTTQVQQKNPVGRPEKPIDWEFVDKLILRQNTATEIAGHFHMHHDTFYARVQEKWGVNFTSYASTVYSKGKSTLRSRQWDKAMEGSVPLLIKLGELYLDDQKPKAKDENQPTKVTFEVNYANANQVEVSPKDVPASNSECSQ